MFDDRLTVMVRDLGKIVYPSLTEIQLHESKLRMHYWLAAHRVPHPQTWVFYDRDYALDFAASNDPAIVYKSDFGSTGSGVRILRSRSTLKRLICKCFKSGIVCRNGDRRDRQWGVVLLQEYLPNVCEWRVIRLGDSYFAHQKLRKGEFHSGSGRVGWYDPPSDLLSFALKITETGKFTSMGLDIFELPGGQYLVNELQSLFGSRAESQMYINGRPGRYLYDPETDAGLRGACS